MNNIQRKFLVSADIQRWLEKQTSTSQKSEQFYSTSSKQNNSFYLKYFPDTYSKVIIDAEGNEEVTPVTKEEYTLQRKNRIGRKLVKKSYTVHIGEDTFVVDKYSKKLEGLYLLFAHFKDEKVVRNSEVIPALQPFIFKEIDQDEKYSDNVLALCVKPMEYNLARLFEKIDAFQASNLFFWQVPPRVYVRDGVALGLYKNIRLINHYKMNYLTKHFNSTLHRLRVLFRRTATILENFSDLFDPNVQNFCIQLLQRYHEETKVLRYLYFLDELCATREHAKLTLYSELKNLISQEEQAVTDMLLSQPFVHLLQILTREVKIHEKQKYNALTDEVQKLVRAHLSGLETLLAKTKDGYGYDLLEEIYTAMDTLQTLLEDFFHIIGEKEAQIIIDELNILLKPLRAYRNCKERKTILDTIKEQSVNKTLDIDPLLCENERELEEKIGNALKLLRTSKFYI
ncbi:hypothetical protein [Sulfurovum sp.]|uniref:hypothetical protein n=1 Tax=Sulfurovum sp. TaxID=1969726 RepID=UPI002868239D|nr:hypothetical protein [Sulfurovum sp.]